ncbi:MULTISPECIES: tetratricopeptide repeat protein [Nostocales]|uniref:Tetratricopeptide TPR_2 repeat-containing protein n=3 Tax=Nostocales TaxID=1161 RepID=A0A0C1R643_9CYAN|nr:tetratricopeptide repeat protein [Tolypothrix bouteillei]KAF3888007.1 tetratricopeptide repeat protein [Tolypothrix bouteillei VB521301]
MDWITLLRSLQADFIKRFTSGRLLHCEIEGQHSELTVISGERLKGLREFCWQMAEKYKRTSPVRDVFISNLKGKLGEEVVKERLADFITEVDYDKRFGGDGKVDFTLTFDSSVGIAVKSRHGSLDKARWSIGIEEVQKNAVVVCILIQEEVNEAQPEYHLFLAGFLPTQMIKLRTGKVTFGMEQLMYGGGLRCYLEQLQTFTDDNFPRQQAPIYRYPPKREVLEVQPKPQLMKPNFYREENIPSPSRNEELSQLYIKLGDEYFEKGKYDGAIEAYNEVLQINPKDIIIYYKRGLARYHLGDYEGAIADYSQAIRINPYYGKVYTRSGLARYHLGDYEGAIADYSQAIRINPNDAFAYKNRADVRSHIGDRQGALEDYSQAMRMNPNLLKDKQGFSQVAEVHPTDADSYKKRGQSRHDMGDYKGAIEDYTQAIKKNPQDINIFYHRANARYDLGDYEEAIKDYSQVIQLNSHDANAYFNRGCAYLNLGNKQEALEDFQRAADFYRKEGKLEEHKNARERVLDLEIEDSLDTLNF